MTIMQIAGLTLRVVFGVTLAMIAISFMLTCVVALFNFIGVV